MIKSIAFDIGMVLAVEDRENQYAELAQEFDYSIEEFNSIRKQYVGQCSRGQISGKDYVFKVGQELGVENLEKYYERWLYYCEKFTKIDYGVMEIIKNLKGKYKITTFTNMIPPHHQVRENMDLYENFDMKILSFEEGFRKPDKEFYDLLIDRLSVEPEEIVFIDDEEKYLGPAQEKGINTILFRDSKQLKEDLAKLDVD